MRQNFESAQTAVSGTPSVSTTGAVAQNSDASVASAPSALGPTAQAVVSEYFAEMERDLIRRAALDGGTALSANERTEALREMHTHLLSLIATYQEIGDDEKTAVSSAIAQFGSAKSVTGSLRRVKTRASSFPLDIAVPMALFTLAMLCPLLVGDTHSYIVQFGWPGLFLLPFAAGAFAANRKGEGAWRRVLAAVGLVIGFTFLTGLGFNERSQTIHGFFLLLRPTILLGLVWSLSAGAGWVTLRQIKAAANKRSVASY